MWLYILENSSSNMRASIVSSILTIALGSLFVWLYYWRNNKRHFNLFWETIKRHNWALVINKKEWLQLWNQCATMEGKEEWYKKPIADKLEKCIDLSCEHILLNMARDYEIKQQLIGQRVNLTTGLNVLVVNYIDGNNLLVYHSGRGYFIAPQEIINIK